MHKVKEDTNLAEYILYLWQIEDLLRALDFDLEQVGKTIVAGFNANDETSLEIYQWYKNLVLMMQKEQITKQGHLQFLKNLVDDFYRFHIQLLQASNDTRYLALYQIAHPLIEEFQQKSNEENSNEIHVALQALYSIMLLKLQHKTISPSTEQAINHISKLIGHLTARYHQHKDGEFEI